MSPPTPADAAPSGRALIKANSWLSQSDEGGPSSMSAALRSGLASGRAAAAPVAEGDETTLPLSTSPPMHDANVLSRRAPTAPVGGVRDRYGPQPAGVTLRPALSPPSGPRITVAPRAAALTPPAAPEVVVVAPLKAPPTPDAAKQPQSGDDADDVLLDDDAEESTACVDALSAPPAPAPSPPPMLPSPVGPPPTPRTWRAAHDSFTTSEETTRNAAPELPASQSLRVARTRGAASGGKAARFAVGEIISSSAELELQYDEALGLYFEPSSGAYFEAVAAA